VSLFYEQTKESSNVGGHDIDILRPSAMTFGHSFVGTFDESRGFITPVHCTAFIDFKQAYDLIPRDKLWDHLNYCQMPQHIVSIFQGLYHAAGEYTMLDGNKRANVQPSFGVKQGCPLFPLLFSIHLNDVDSLAEGVQGVITGIPDFTVTHLLFDDDLSLASTPDHNELQTMLNKLRVCAHKKSFDSEHPKV